MGHKQVWRAQNMTEEKGEILIYFCIIYQILALYLINNTKSLRENGKEMRKQEFQEFWAQKFSKSLSQNGSFLKVPSCSQSLCGANPFRSPSKVGSVTMPGERNENN